MFCFIHKILRKRLSFVILCTTNNPPIQTLFNVYSCKVITRGPVWRYFMVSVKKIIIIVSTQQNFRGNRAHFSECKQYTRGKGEGRKRDKKGGWVVVVRGSTLNSRKTCSSPCKPKENSHVHCSPFVNNIDATLKWGIKSKAPFPHTV